MKKKWQRMTQVWLKASQKVKTEVQFRKVGLVTAKYFSQQQG